MTVFVETLLMSALHPKAVILGKVQRRLQSAKSGYVE